MAVGQQDRMRHPDTTSAAEYVYGVTWASTAFEADSGGVCDAPVRSVTSRDLTALTSGVDKVPVRARKRDLTRHSDVIAAAFRRGTIVPIRFGTVFPDQDAVVSELLEPRRGELAELLRRLEGFGELRVSATYVEPEILRDIVASDAGIARLREASRSQPEAASRGLRLELGERVAAALAARADADARRIVDRLRRLARDVVVDERLTELQVVRASFLVDLADLGRFDAALEELAQGEAGRMQVKEVGPLAPHSFVSLEERG